MIDWTRPGCLTALLDSGGLTLSELSNRSGVTRSQLQRINGGMAPRFATQRAIEAAFKGQCTPPNPRPNAKRGGTVQAAA
jgi:predicted transcriptional regulator